MMQHDDPPFLTVGTEVSAKYKGAFCEAKVNKIVKNVKIKVTFKYGMGSAVLSDESIKGSFKVGAQVKAFHSEKNQFLDGIINKIQDCSQYTVVFDDGDITTLRRSSLCLKSGRHFAESETLDQLPLTHPEHFGTPVVGGRRGRRSRNHLGSEESSEEEENVHKRHQSRREEWEADMGKVVCVEIGDKKKQKDNWFPGLVVAPTAQDTVKIETKKDYLVRSFQDGRYYTVPKKEANLFTREVGTKVSQTALRTAVDKALLYIDKDELPPHWDRDLLFGVDLYDSDMDRDSDSDSSDDEPREEKDHFVAQLYKYMEECNTPINKGPTLGNKDLDLYKLFKVVQKLGGFNRVMNQNQWKIVSVKMGLNTLGSQASTLVKAAYKRYLQSFDDFYRKLGCTMVSNPRGSRMRHRSGRSLIRDCDKRPQLRKGTESCDSTEEEVDKKAEEEEVKKDEKKKDDKKKEDTKKEEVKRSETPVKKDTRRKDAETAEIEKKETKKKEAEVIETDKKETRKKDMEIAEPDKKETRKRDNDMSEADKKESEKKKEELKLQSRNRTPPVVSSRTSSPTTRERLREMKTPKSETKTKLFKKEIKEKEEEQKLPPASSKEEKKKDLESLEEIEMAKTRSLRNREEKEKEKEPLKVKEEKEPLRFKEEKEKERLSIKIKEEKEKERPLSKLKEEKEKERPPSKIKEEKEKERTASKIKEEKEKERTASKIKEEKEKERAASKIKEEKEKERAASKIKEEKERAASKIKEDKEKERTALKIKEEKEKERAASKIKEEKDKERPPLKIKDEKEKESDLLKKSGERKMKLDHHQRSASCNSTSSGSSSSSSTCTSSSTGNLTDGKGCSKSKLQLPKSLCQLEEMRKRGRRRKLEDSEFPPDKSNLPMHIPISIGDRLRVLYGPNSIESKITYEAKVLEIEGEGCQKKYYVHYLGWNTRYDEWVIRQRVAQNLSWNQYRNKRGRTFSKDQEKKDEKDEKEESKDGGPPEGEHVSSSTRRHGMSLKRGRSVHGPRQESEKPELTCPSSQKVTTRSDSANHPHSVTPQLDKGEERRRSRRNVSSSMRDTEDSDSDDYESGADCSDRERMRRTSSGNIPSSVSTSPGNVTPEPFNPESFNDMHEAEIFKDIQIKQENQLPLLQGSPSCGKDIDLKAIESEMKGLDRPIKKEDGQMSKEITLGLSGSTGILTTVIPGSLTITEKKKHDPLKPNDSPAKRVEIPVRLVPAQEIMGHIKPLPICDWKKEPLLEDDIYEFKEPEPFEFGEIRTRKDNKMKNSGSQDDTEPEVMVKKKGRAKKDNDEKSGSESDCPVTPQKRILLMKDSKESSPLKLEIKESPVKIEHKEGIRTPEIKKDYSRRIDVKEQIKTEDIILVPKDNEIQQKGINLLSSSTWDFQIKEVSSPSDGGEKPLLIDLYRDSNRPLQRSLDLKDLKVENIDGKELHMIGTSVVVTPKKMPPKKELTNLESKAGLSGVKAPDSEGPFSPKSTGQDKLDDSGMRPTRESPKPVGLISENVTQLKPTSVMARIPGHVLAQVVMPPTELRVLAKPSSKVNIDIKEEKICLPHVEYSNNLSIIPKHEEKCDGRVIPFSQRQQHIFPHLLKRSETPEEKGLDNVMPVDVAPPSPVINIPIPPTPAHFEVTANPIQRPHASTEVEKSSEKARCESTVEESIEAVVLRARQELMQMKQEKKPELKCFDKRRRNPGRSKKALSREFLPESSEESDCDHKGEKSEHVGPRQKRFKGGDGASKYSPAKRISRVITEVDKQHVRRCDEEERANDADEEDNESNFPPLKILSKEADKRRKEMEVENIIETEVPIHEKELFKIGLLKKRRRSSAAVKRSDENEETGLGDLLCEETIPPGSPMQHDHLTVDTDPPVPQTTIKQEMPFASVPTGSSFSKRTTAVSAITSSESSVGHLHASLQQIHSSVCVQSVLQSSVSQPYSSPPTIQPNVTITSIRPISHSIPLHSNKPIPVATITEKSHDVQSSVMSVSTHSKSVISKIVNDADLKQPLPCSSDLLCHKPINSSNAGSVIIIPTARTSAMNLDRVEEQLPNEVNRPLPNIDNTPPTTPESIITTPSDSPRRENEASSKTEDNSTKSGLYSSEMEFDKMDNLSEDSNTMDSNSCPSKSLAMKRPVPNTAAACTQSHSEGWDTEDGNIILPKRRKRGSKVRSVPTDHDKDFQKSSHHAFSTSFTCSSGSRRKRLHSNSKTNDEEHDFHGVTLLSVAASHVGGRSRYNFCQELDPELDAGKRIAVLHNRMQELKRTYMQVKSELASVERRRKKLRKKEREKEAHIEAN